MTTARVLLSAPDWLTARGIEQALQVAGHEVVLVPEHASAVDTQPIDIGLVAIDDALPVGSNPVVADRASRDVPVIWLLNGGHLTRLLTVSAVTTVGIVVMPAHEVQLLATVAVGIGLARQARVSPHVSVTHPAPTLAPMDLGPWGAALEQHRLTRRQRDIVMMLLNGDRVSTIAHELRVQPSTVRAHLNRIYGKLGVHSQALLIRSIKAGVLPRSSPFNPESRL